MPEADRPLAARYRSGAFAALANDPELVTRSRAMSSEPADPSVRIVLIEDQQLLADALAGVLPTRGEHRVVSIASTLEQGLEAVRRHRPDLVLADFRLPDGDVVDLLPAMLDAAPGTKVLVYSGWSDESSLLGALAAGAAGYVEKTSSIDALLDAIRRVLSGETVVDPRLVPLLTRRAVGGASQALSARELEILELLAAGRSTAEIAADLHLAPSTVGNTITRVLAKLDARSRLDAVRIAVARGMIRFDPPRP
jgi:two-component system, NarL family, nitrate/nitrite response regulator NarL